MIEETHIRNGELYLRLVCGHAKDLSKERNLRSVSNSGKILGQQPKLLFYLGSSHEKRMQHIFFSTQILINIFLSRRKLKMKLNKPQHQTAGGTLDLYICKTRPFKRKKKECFVFTISRYLCGAIMSSSVKIENFCCYYFVQ